MRTSFGFFPALFNIIIRKIIIVIILKDKKRLDFSTYRSQLWKNLSK